MARREWFRAAQVPVLPVSAGAAAVGTVMGSGYGGSIDVPVASLVFASLITIQVAANLQKGLVEAADLEGEPTRPKSGFVFDAGALKRTGTAPARARALTSALFGMGALFGLTVVVLRADLVLFVLGVLGAFFAYSYSGPPLKLSYRGIGELSTFIAFGPLMVWGAFRAQTPGGFELGPSGTGIFFVDWETFFVGLAFGALAAMISFARYFPAAKDDRARGKNTPVVRLGGAPAARVFVALASVGAAAFAAAAIWTGPDWCSMLLVYPPPPRLSPNLWIAAAATILIGLGAGRALVSSDPARAEAAVARTVLLHYMTTAVVVGGFLASLPCRL